jgi:hypothetical protein
VFSKVPYDRHAVQRERNATRRHYQPARFPFANDNRNVCREYCWKGWSHAWDCTGRHAMAVSSLACVTGDCATRLIFPIYTISQSGSRIRIHRWITLVNSFELLDTTSMETNRCTLESLVKSSKRTSTSDAYITSVCDIWSTINSKSELLVRSTR